MGGTSEKQAAYRNREGRSLGELVLVVGLVEPEESLVKSLSESRPGDGSPGPTSSEQPAQQGALRCGYAWVGKPQRRIGEE